MKTPPDENTLSRWLDGEMPAAERAEFEKRLQADPDLRAEVESLQKLSAMIRAKVPAEMPLPHADFFNSQIQVRIAQEENGASARRKPARSGWLDWLRLPTLATAAAAVALTAIIVSQFRDGASTSASVVLSSYVPDPAIQARTFHSEEANATVVLLDGLADIPPDRKIVGFKVDHSETDSAVATTTLYSKDGGILLVVASDASNRPRLMGPALAD